MQRSKSPEKLQAEFCFIIDFLIVYFIKYYLIALFTFYLIFTIFQ